MLQNDSLKCCLRFAGPLQCYQGVIKKLLVYPTVTWKAKSRVDKPWGVKRNWKLSLTLGCTSSVTNKASRLHALLFLSFHSRFTGAQSVENEVSYVLSNRFMIRYNAHVVLWNTKCWCWIWKLSSFCNNIFRCCKMLRVLCQPLHNIF